MSTKSTEMYNTCLLPADEKITAVAYQLNKNTRVLKDKSVSLHDKHDVFLRVLGAECQDNRSTFVRFKSSVALQAHDLFSTLKVWHQS